MDKAVIIGKINDFLIDEEGWGRLIGNGNWYVSDEYTGNKKAAGLVDGRPLDPAG